MYGQTDRQTDECMSNGSSPNCSDVAITSPRKGIVNVLEPMVSFALFPGEVRTHEVSEDVIWRMTWWNYIHIHVFSVRLWSGGLGCFAFVVFLSSRFAFSVFPSRILLKIFSFGNVRGWLGGNRHRRVLVILALHV